MDIRASETRYSSAANMLGCSPVTEDHMSTSLMGGQEMAAALDPVLGYDHTALSHEVADVSAEERAVGMDLRPWLGKSVFLRMVTGRDLIGEMEQRADGVIQFRPDVAEDWDWFPRHLENDGTAIELTGRGGRLLADVVKEIRACITMEVTSVKRKTVASKILWSLGDYKCEGAMITDKGPWTPEARLLEMADGWDPRYAKKERVLKTVADPAANLKKVQDDIRRRELAHKLQQNARRKNKVDESRISGAMNMKTQAKGSAAMAA